MDEIKFGTDGWRSLMDGSFNVENVKKVAQAIAGYVNDSGLGDKGIFVGYDTRANSDTFARACADVLKTNNIEAYVPERPMPTPITAYAIKSNNLAGAIMLTASHNPPQYNGIKFIPFYAGPATEDITAKIESNLERIDSRQRAVDKNVIARSVINVAIQEIDPVPEYFEQLKSLVDTELLKKANLNILVNPMHGAAYRLFAQFLTDCGCRIKEIDGQPDPNFGGLTPEPIPGNLQSTIRLLKEDSYDLVLALDGDADRFGVFDGNANFIQANHVLALIAEYLITVKNFQGDLVRSVATTHFLDFIAERNGLELIETPVGFKYIGQIMREKPVVLGGEESAGLSILGHIPEKDGLLANLLLAEITAYYQKPLGDILEDLFTKYNRHFITKRLDLELSDEKKANIMEQLYTKPPSNIAGLKVAETIDIDGVKFILEDESWLLARPSGTEPIVRIYLETDQEQVLEKLVNYALHLANS